MKSAVAWLRLPLAVAGVAVATLGFAASAHAGVSQESMFQDDRLLQGSSPETQARALDELRALGVSSIHAVINWNKLSPSPNTRSVPRGFRGADPASYDSSRWRVIDGLVRGAQARSIQVLLSPSGPAPEWALRCHARPKGVCRPKPRLYGQFVSALAQRYSGSYPDGSGGTLPRVSRWSIWNEPNLKSWLSPQIRVVRRRIVPVAAATYRDLVYAATGALRAGGHGGDQILLGETAPLGSGSSAMAPATFYRALFCIDAKGKRLRGRAARDTGCQHRRSLQVTGVAHHPYTRRASQDPLTKPRATDITMANLGVLTKILRQANRSRMLRRGAKRIWLTEFGVSSRPPAKRGYGVSPLAQAEWINLFEYLAFKNPAVSGVAQYELEDDSHLRNNAFQTGLQLADGKDKPALAAYRMPLYVQVKGRTLTVWGGVRGVATGTVDIFRNGTRVRSASLRNGYFRLNLANASGEWQTAYTPPGGATIKSRVADPRALRRGF